MNSRKSFITAVILSTLLTTLVAGAAFAEDDAAEEKTVGVNVDLGFGTIYNFRGANVFKEDHMMDQNGAFFPSVTWAIADSGVYIGYWGAYQLSGKNIAANVNGALGHEQDFYAGYDKSFGPDDMMTFSLAFTYFCYPFATGDVENPSFIEPLAGFSVSTVVDLGLNVSYFAGVDDVTKPYSHLYIKPSIGKSFSFGERFGLDMSLGAGFKVWTGEEGEKPEDNDVDLAFDFALPIALEGSLYATPAVSFAWTNLDGLPAGEEYMVYGSLNIGADF